MFRQKKERERPSAARTRLVGITAQGDTSLFSLNWDPGYPEPVNGFVHRIWFNVRIKDPDENGFHPADEGEYLHDLSEAFETAAEGRALLVGSVTGGGVKQFCYYANSVDWIAEYETVLKNTEARGFSLKVEEDPAWEAYKAILADAVQADSDRRVFTLLDEGEADLERPHEIDWFVYFPTEDQARAAEHILLEHEYQVQLNAPEKGSVDQWCVIATLTVVLSVGYIARMTAMFIQFARDHGGTYDGWGANVDPKRSASGTA